ncbi:hypothetical protein ACM26X_17495 [Kluyvera cryocrescens]|uniref:hypothetical protein n=1 Tax=Kluyvera cryocrescens TaxID=580 RepID=UPI0039F530A3
MHGLLLRLRWIKRSNNKALLFRIILRLTPLFAVEPLLSLFLKINFLNKEVLMYERVGKISERNRKNGVAAIIRAYPQNNPLLMAVRSIIEHVDQVVIVFNGEKNVDFDKLLADQLAFQPQLADKIKIDVYLNRIQKTGDDYYQSVYEDPDLSIARFYNFAFSLSDFETVVKWDDDMIPCNHKKAFRTPCRLVKAISYDGYDATGRTTTSMEPRIFKLRKNVKYFDSDFCERINLGLGIKWKYFKKVYVHLKLLRSGLV